MRYQSVSAHYISSQNESTQHTHTHTQTTDTNSSLYHVVYKNYVLSADEFDDELDTEAENDLILDNPPTELSALSDGSDEFIRGKSDILITLSRSDWIVCSYFKHLP
mmetsp:Transcript_43691/g.70038  ORF Transcript_43691/g.70038 Transcript_43691/m.70038 type:complete len:107 (+) Transcript_43691:64-384(+)